VVQYSVICRYSWVVAPALKMSG